MSIKVLQGHCVERLDFMAVTALNQPDFRTVSDFRKRHLKALQGLFVQVLKLAQKAGLARLGHVALDGTKIKANASKHKAMSYGRMQTTETVLTEQVQGWLATAEREDADEDRRLQATTGEELPAWVTQKQQRLDKIHSARLALEAEAQAAAGHTQAPSDDDLPQPVPMAPRRTRPSATSPIPIPAS